MTDQNETAVRAQAMLMVDNYKFICSCELNNLFSAENISRSIRQ
jgi:hypothetical protein